MQPHAADTPAGQIIAAFDLDGTLTRRDTLPAFLAFACGWPRLLLGAVVLLPRLVAMRLGLLPRAHAKAAVLAHYLGGWEHSRLQALGQRFADAYMPGILYADGLGRLAWHRAQGHRCFLVTASPDIWTAPWAAAQGLELVATRAEIRQGRFTGAFDGPNCRGPEKVRRLLAALDGQRPAFVYAYGNSAGDRELLAWADEAHYRPFSQPAT
ncbi:MAG: HAD-IB family hydrolase [Bacteroidia bacterium]